MRKQARSRTCGRLRLRGRGAVLARAKSHVLTSRMARHVYYQMWAIAEHSIALTMLVICDIATSSQQTG